MNDIKKNLPTISAILFFLAAGLAFYWGWSNSLASTDLSSSSDDYTVVSIGEDVTKVKTILEGRQNIVGMPLSAPTDGVGRTNPFAGL